MSATPPAAPPATEAAAQIYTLQGVKALHVTAPVAIRQLNNQALGALAKLYDGVQISVDQGNPAVEITLATDSGPMTLRIAGNFTADQISQEMRQLQRILNLGRDTIFHCHRAALSTRRKPTPPAAPGNNSRSPDARSSQPRPPTAEPATAPAGGANPATP